MTDYPPPTPEAIAALKRIGRQIVTLTDHELVEDVDGALMGVTANDVRPRDGRGCAELVALRSWTSAGCRARCVGPRARRGVAVWSLQVTEWERSRGFERR